MKTYCFVYSQENFILVNYLHSLIKNYCYAKLCHISFFRFTHMTELLKISDYIPLQNSEELQKMENYCLSLD